MSKAAIIRHAQKHLAGRGKIEVKKGEYGAYGIYETCVVLTCADRVEYYHAWADRNAVAMHKTRTAPLPALPLFSHIQPEADT